MRDWERRLLLALLWPIFWLQGQHVRRVKPRMPEAVGSREGICGQWPPMHACKALPQPLRWFMGRWAPEMNLLLSGLLSGKKRRTMHWHLQTTTSTGMAADGFHPSSQGYAQWADDLSQLILAARV